MVRNSVDHGVDSPEERASAGKPERATITLAIARRDQHVIVSIRDDGRGIDWPAIARRAKTLDLPHGTPRELEDVLFADGVSSRTEVTQTSGRGVGLSAVRAVVLQLGGKIEILTEPGVGTTFQFVLPEATLESELASLAPEAPRVSRRVALS